MAEAPPATPEPEPTYPFSPINPADLLLSEADIAAMVPTQEDIARWTGRLPPRPRGRARKQPKPLE